eukprot:SAG31_NODE_310_length_17887_cov_4.623060_7_plen_236_part_00
MDAAARIAASPIHRDGACFSSIFQFPAGFVGRLIGQKGSNLTEIKNTTGIHRVDIEPAKEGELSREVQVWGYDAQAVRAANAAVANILSCNKFRQQARMCAYDARNLKLSAKNAGKKKKVAHPAAAAAAVRKQAREAKAAAGVPTGRKFDAAALVGHRRESISSTASESTVCSQVTEPLQTLEGGVEKTEDVVCTDNGFAEAAASKQLSKRQKKRRRQQKAKQIWEAKAQAQAVV